VASDTDVWAYNTHAHRWADPYGMVEGAYHSSTGHEDKRECPINGASLCQVDLDWLVVCASAGPGSDWSEESVVGVEPAALDFVVVSGVLPGPSRCRDGRRAGGGGRQRRRGVV
jgi:hypothetical protein